MAAERDGIVLDFADFGNSPYNFSRERVEGSQVVYSTTNGTNAIHLASSASEVLIGAYLNLSSLTEYLAESNCDLLILCAGWKNKFNLEDTLFAGALAKGILKKGNHKTICDSAIGAIDLYDLASDNMMSYIEKVAQRERLRKNGLDDVIGYCHTADQTKVIPVLRENYLTVL